MINKMHAPAAMEIVEKLHTLAAMKIAKNNVNHDHR
jgi:hypothetical protein